ncbi:15054_t:CDS:2, partial [Racocetra fulgida]
LLKNLSSKYSNVGELITFSENLHFLPGEFDNEFIETFKDFNESEEENSLNNNNKKHWIVAENGVVRALDNVVPEDYMTGNFDFQKFNHEISENEKSNSFVQNFVQSIIGGKTYGVAKRVNLIAVKSLDNEGIGSVESVLYGLQYVIQSHLAKGGKGKTVAKYDYIIITYDSYIIIAKYLLMNRYIDCFIC